MRNLGGSIGIAMLSTMIDRRGHTHFSVLAEVITQNATRTQERAGCVGGRDARLHRRSGGKVQPWPPCKPSAVRGVRNGLCGKLPARGVSHILSFGIVAILKKRQRAAGPIAAH